MWGHVPTVCSLSSSPWALVSLFQSTGVFDKMISTLTSGPLDSVILPCCEDEC